MANEMAEKGFKKTPDQCKTKIHTLKRAYRESKKYLKKSGKGRKLCKYFEELDNILASRPASSPLKIVETMRKRRLDNGTDTDESSSDESNDGKMPEAVVEAADIVDMTERENQTDDHIGNTGNEKGKDDDSKRDKEKKRDEMKKITKASTKGKKKSRLEVALGTVMENFGSAIDRSEDKFIELEKQKIELEKKRLDMERAKMEFEEKQKREERQHQFNMMKMIMDGMGQRNLQQPVPGTSFAPSRESFNTSSAGQWHTDDSSSFNTSIDSTFYNM